MVKVVPEKLRPIMGKGALKRSLRTRDPAEAKRLAPPVIAEFDARVAAAWAQHRGATVRLSARDVAAIVGDWYRREAAKVEEEPGDPRRRDAEADIVANDRVDPEDGTVSATAEDMEAASILLEEKGLAADRVTRRKTAEAIARARMDLSGLALRRASGDWSADPVAATFPAFIMAPKREERLPAEDLLKAWAAERTPAAATRVKYARSFAHVARILGFDDVRRITADGVVEFKRQRLADGVDPGTVADDVLACGAVCRWAATNRLLPLNPFAGLAPKVVRRGPAPVDPYSDDEAKRILIAARGEAGWLRWAPWLLCFTGARVSEFAEMRRGHVRQDGGVWIFDMIPTEQREGKNATFQRMIPLHPAIIAEGFLEYLTAFPKDPAKPLFPDLAPDPRGGRVTPAISKMGRWLRGTVKIIDAKKAPNHSWRHRMEDELRKVRALPEVQDAITGRHNPRNAGAGYGKGFRGMPVEVLKDLGRVPSPLDSGNDVPA
ncbi:hypothetical protein KHU32_09770 [Roseococcus sp. XZZS9]|uniref:DUF6538 domain-containing protein n=1 Tax=Roseococcus pinisoli TaxID=2835040 RepID=A0ABS5QCG3_9PROT|nr:DUF6538 domain-containing protein [Roseococcus pinisoli]MBS7811224.1 hypothetical protein [Roseococcus pinisoli]